MEVRKIAAVKALQSFAINPQPILAIERLMKTASISNRLSSGLLAQLINLVTVAGPESRKWACETAKTKLSV